MSLSDILSSLGCKMTKGWWSPEKQRGSESACETSGTLPPASLALQRGLPRHPAESALWVELCQRATEIMRFESTRRIPSALDSFRARVSTAQLLTQSFARFVQLRFGVPDRTPTNLRDLVVLVAMYIVEDEHRLVTFG
jgi:hypothetical protein